MTDQTTQAQPSPIRAIRGLEEGYAFDVRITREDVAEREYLKGRGFRWNSNGYWTLWTTASSRDLIAEFHARGYSWLGQVRRELIDGDYRFYSEHPMEGARPAGQFTVIEDRGEDQGVFRYVIEVTQCQQAAS